MTVRTETVSWNLMQPMHSALPAVEVASYDDYGYPRIRGYEQDLAELPIGTKVFVKLPSKCMCGAKFYCDYEWAPDCDLGKNEVHCQPAFPQPKL